MIPFLFPPILSLKLGKFIVVLKRICLSSLQKLPFFYPFLHILFCLTDFLLPKAILLLTLRHSHSTLISHFYILLSLSFYLITLSISEIATTLAFNSQSYFTLIFKEHFNETPLSSHF